MRDSGTSAAHCDTKRGNQPAHHDTKAENKKPPPWAPAEVYHQAHQQPTQTDRQAHRQTTPHSLDEAAAPKASTSKPNHTRHQQSTKSQTRE